MLRQLVRPVARQTVQGSRAYHPPANYRHPTLDDIPVPQGCWKADYDKKQKRYNMQLAAGILMLVTSIIATKQRVFFNWSPPVPKEKKD